MEGDPPVERVVQGDVADVRVEDRPNHVEVEGVPAEAERLPDLGELHILKPPLEALVPRAVEHDVPTVHHRGDPRPPLVVLIAPGGGAVAVRRDEARRVAPVVAERALHLDVAREQPHLPRPGSREVRAWL